MNQDNDNHGAAAKKDDFSSTPAWLEQTGASIAGPTATSPKKSKRFLIICSTLFILVCIFVGFMLFSSQSTSCFNANNYQGLIDIIKPVDDDDIQVTDAQPQQPLYTYTAYFFQGTSDFDSEKSPENPTDFLQSVGSYYQKQHVSSPFSVQISTSYVAGDSLDLAQKRVNHVQSILQQAGLDISVISTPQPTLIPLTDETKDDDDVVDGTPVLIGITPTSRCEAKN